MAPAAFPVTRLAGVVKSLFPQHLKSHRFSPPLFFLGKLIKVVFGHLHFSFSSM